MIRARHLWIRVLTAGVFLSLLDVLCLARLWPDRPDLHLVLCAGLGFVLEEEFDAYFLIWWLGWTRDLFSGLGLGLFSLCYLLVLTALFRLRKRFDVQSLVGCGLVGLTAAFLESCVLTLFSLGEGGGIGSFIGAGVLLSLWRLSARRRSAA